jgi:hypothetical protein
MNTRNSIVHADRASGRAPGATSAAPERSREDGSDRRNLAHTVSGGRETASNAAGSRSAERLWMRALERWENEGGRTREADRP